MIQEQQNNNNNNNYNNEIVDINDFILKVIQRRKEIEENSYNSEKIDGIEIE